MSKTYSPNVVIEACRSDLHTFTHSAFQLVSPGDNFVDGIHIQAMAHWLVECLHGNVKRLIITVPPRHLKSIMASVAFPAFSLGRDPTKKIICVSYSNDLACKLSRDCRTLMESPFYKRTFPRTVLSPEKNTQNVFETTSRGFRYATSVGGTLTGLGGDVIVIDDPLKPDDAESAAGRAATNEWYERTLYSRLNNPSDSVIVIVTQRLHPEDLVGHVLQKEDWVHLNLPVIADSDHDITIGPNRTHRRRSGDVLHPARMSRQDLDRIRKTVGPRVFSAQYQQAPIPADGEIVKLSWFKRFDVALTPNAFRDGYIVQSWDTAVKATQLSDYSVCTTWYIEDDQFYLIDVYRERLDYPTLRQRLLDLAEYWSASMVLIEDSANGPALVDDLYASNLPNVPELELVSPQGDKVLRMVRQSAKIHAGNVHLPERAPWLQTYLDELLLFPKARYDDQVDSTTQFLGWAESALVDDDGWFAAIV